MFDSLQKQQRGVSQEVTERCFLSQDDIQKDS